jgi:hypothetical protein
MISCSIFLLLDGSLENVWTANKECTFGNKKFAIYPLTTPTHLSDSSYVPYNATVLKVQFCPKTKQ